MDRRRSDIAISVENFEQIHRDAKRDNFVDFEDFCYPYGNNLEATYSPTKEIPHLWINSSVDRSSKRRAEIGGP